MSLVCLSFSHQHVPIAFRERVYFDANAMANACARFRCGDARPSTIIEMAILSTCNRTEIYAFSKNEEINAPSLETFDELHTFVQQARDVERSDLERFGKLLTGTEAVDHLSRVACGLESLVLGEPQILGQVGDAMRLGLIMNSSGPVLTKLFQTAVKSGRRARTETQISQNSLNISTVAVITAERELGSLEGKTVVVLGAGEMADLALTQLRNKGVSRIKVVNRTIAKASELATKHDGKAFVFEHINDLLPKADVLITSTGAPHTLITREMIEYAMEVRPERPMMILDIAVPRDVEMAVEEIPNVQRCDIDDLHMTTGESARLREEQIPQVESIIQSEIDQFMKWFRGIGIESTIVGLRQKADEIRNNELQRLANLLPAHDPSSWNVIERFAESLVNKLLHDPTIQLRHFQGTREALDYGEAVRQLFRLETDRVREAVEVETDAR
jgi:glutamyl-tRNA reductase